MANSSILGGAKRPETVIGKDTDALGPSDNSDSGSDVQGAYGDDEMSSDSDAAGTGERTSAGAGRDRVDADILPDHIEGDEDDADAVADETLAALDELAAEDDDPDAELDEESGQR